MTNPGKMAARDASTSQSTVRARARSTSTCRAHSGRPGRNTQMKGGHQKRIIQHQSGRPLHLNKKAPCPTCGQTCLTTSLTHWPTQATRRVPNHNQRTSLTWSEDAHGRAGCARRARLGTRGGARRGDQNHHTMVAPGTPAVHQSFIPEETCPGPPVIHTRGKPTG